MKFFKEVFQSEVKSAFSGNDNLKCVKDEAGKTDQEKVFEVKLRSKAGLLELRIFSFETISH